MDVIARVDIYDPGGVTLRGTLPTVGLRFGLEVGGSGSVDFQALHADLDTLGAWDAVAKVLIQPAPPAGAWHPFAAYAIRPPHSWARVGKPLVGCQGVAVLAQWAAETLAWPEYAVDQMPRGAGIDRAIGWQSTFYDPVADPGEPWAGIYHPSRSTYPTNSATRPGTVWPTGSGAQWVSITGASDQAERKLFRTKSATPLTITAAGPIRVYAASDSPGDLYVAGEPVLRVEGGEPGKDPILFEQVDMFMQPGQYAVAFDTESVWDTGGDGVDPVIVAICTLDGDGNPAGWLRVTNTTDWVACRRDVEPPDNEPPGPTPGAVLAALHAEAQERHATGWDQVTLGFDGAADSYGAAWPEQVVERLVRYGSDTYWAMWQSWADSDEVDVWMGPDLVLHAAPIQGQNRTSTVTLDTTGVATMNGQRSPDPGTHVVALALDGWLEDAQDGPRREYGLEVGTAISRAVAARVAAASLAENGRWDAAARLAPLCPHVPGIAFSPGDRVALTYPGAPASARVLSMSAQAVDGALQWDVELVEVTG